MRAKAVAVVVGTNQDLHQLAENILIRRCGIAYYPLATPADCTIAKLECLAAIGIDLLVIDGAGPAGSRLLAAINESAALRRVKTICLDWRNADAAAILAGAVLRCLAPEPTATREVG